MSRANSKRDPDALRITSQYVVRQDGSMVYELRAGTSKLVLASSANRSTDSQEWRFEAKTPQLPDVAVMGEWAATRALALQGVAALWKLRELESGLPGFDWDNVATVLADVKGV